MSQTMCECGAPLTLREGSPCTNDACKHAGVWNADAEMQASTGVDLEALRESMESAPQPLKTDTTAFGRWLRMQVRRQDPVGQLARVAVRDPFWPCPESRMETANYFIAMGARPFVLRTVKIAWDEYDAGVRRATSRSKNKAARKARKKTKQQQRAKKK